MVRIDFDDTIATKDERDELRSVGDDPGSLARLPQLNPDFDEFWR